MAISRFSNSSVANGFPKYQRFWDQSSVELTGAFESIQTFTVTSGGSATVSFTSIPSTYKHLQVRILARSSAAGNEDDIYMRFNNDTGSNYSGHQIYGDGSSSGAGLLGGTPPVNLIYPAYILANSAIANAYGAAIIDILDYTNTNKNKLVRSLNGHDRNGGGLILFRSGLWMNTSVISSITFTFNSGSYMQYSSLALYGIKG